MKELRQEFLQRSTANLDDLRKSLLDEGATENWRRTAFRTLHTIKGTAQTFGLTTSGHLAHELETFLSATALVSADNFTNLFIEGVELLKDSFEQNNFTDSAQFIEKIKIHFPQNTEASGFENTPTIEIPNEIYERLSRTEKLELESAARSGKVFYVFEVGFDLADFTDKFKKLREALGESGEVVATSPSAKFSGKIGFEILLASEAEFQKLRKIADDYSAEIIFQSSANDFPADLHGVLSKVTAHGKSVANGLGKKIDFEIKAEKVNLSAEKLKLIFDVLLHLIRNSVDHAFKTTDGKIEIDLTTKNGNLYLTVADDGDGVDLEKVKARATEKKLISGGENLSEQATLELIFQSEFSTAEKLTEISGRGIGLDAVKYLIENAGGKIGVVSRKGKGAKFEIYLPEQLSGLRNTETG